MSGHRRRLTALTAAATATLLAAGTIGASVPATAAVPLDLLCSGTVSPQSNTSTPSTPPVAVNDTARVVAGFGQTVNVLRNDTDADGDKLYVAGLPTPDEGFTCVNGDNTIQYFAPMVRRDVTETFRYGVTDGDRYRTGTVSVAVEGVMPVRADVRKRLKYGKDKRVVRKARLAFTNPTSADMYVAGGNPRGNGGPTFERLVRPGKTIVVRTRLRALSFVAVLVSEDDFAPVNFGLVNTRTARQKIVYFGDEESFFRKGAKNPKSPTQLWTSRLQ